MKHAQYNFVGTVHILPNLNLALIDLIISLELLPVTWAWAVFLLNQLSSTQASIYLKMLNPLIRHFRSWNLLPTEHQLSIREMWDECGNAQAVVKEMERMFQFMDG